MLTARVLPPSLKTENRTLSPVTAPSGCLTHPLELQTELRRQPCLRSIHILQPQPPDCNTYLSVLPLLFRCKPFIPRLKNPAKPPAGLHLVLCKARPGPLRVLPAAETRPAPERDSLVPALPRQIWTQSEQRQRRLNWRLQAWDQSRSYCWSSRSTQAGEIIQLKRYKKRPADSRRTGRI